MKSCVFCNIADGIEGELIREWVDAVAFVPLHPVVDGHVLVIPREHVDDVTVDPHVSAITMMRAAEIASAPCNIITSAGRAATQSIFHLHVHVVPRAPGDGLALPWPDSP